MIYDIHNVNTSLFMAETKGYPIKGFERHVLPSKSPQR
jgi:hypothetical protein